MRYTQVRLQPPPGLAPVAHRPNAVEWAKAELGWEFPPHQQEVLLSEASRVLVCDGRLAGKTMLLAAAALYSIFCFPGSLVLYVSPHVVGAEGFLHLLCATVPRSYLSSLQLRDPYLIHLVARNGSSLYSIEPHEVHRVRGTRVDVLLLDDVEIMDGHYLGQLLLLRSRRVIAASTPDPDRPRSPFKSWCRNRSLSGWHLPYYPFFLCPMHEEGMPCAYTIMARRS